MTDHEDASAEWIRFYFDSETLYEYTSVKLRQEFPVRSGKEMMLRPYEDNQPQTSLPIRKALLQRH